MSDLIDRESAIVRACAVIKDDCVAYDVVQALKALPSAQTDRDIPRKPIEGCSLSGRKKVKEASCPNCNFFLSHFRFYGEGKRITYCEHCGQAIDWEGWEFDE
mgnify:FL=1